MPTHAWAFVVLAAAGAPLAGCGNACVDLATTICDCSPTTAEQTACHNGVETQKLAQNANKAQLERCQELKDTCTCEALGARDLAACGLARDSGLPPPEQSSSR